MKERPILFQGAMVRALLDGTKTQTRRVVKPAPTGGFDLRMHKCESGYVYAASYENLSWEKPERIRWDCPYGQPGERLWVRETWQYADWTEDGLPFIRYRADDAKVLHESIPSDEWAAKLQDIWIDLSGTANFAIDNTAADRRWRPAIHMPRWACRTILEITGVRVERVQSISESDAAAEGVYTDPACPAYDAYTALWDSINGKTPGAAWADNPWVWVVSFKRTGAA